MKTTTQETDGRIRKTAGALRHSRKRQEKVATDSLGEHGNHTANAEKALRIAKEAPRADDEEHWS